MQGVLAFRFFFRSQFYFLWITLSNLEDSSVPWALLRFYNFSHSNFADLCWFIFVHSLLVYQMEKCSNLARKTPHLVIVRSAVEKLTKILQKGTSDERRSFGLEPPVGLENNPGLFCCIFLSNCSYRNSNRRPLANLTGSHLNTVASKFPLLSDSNVKYFVCISHYHPSNDKLTVGRGKGPRSDIIAKWAKNPEIPPGYNLRIPTLPKSDQFRAWHSLNSDWRRFMMSQGPSSSNQNVPR